jgi:hypothetical protein
VWVCVGVCGCVCVAHDKTITVYKNDDVWAAILKLLRFLEELIKLALVGAHAHL